MPRLSSSVISLLKLILILHFWTKKNRATGSRRAGEELLWSQDTTSAARFKGGSPADHQLMIRQWSAGAGRPAVSEELFYRVMYLSWSTWTKLRLADVSLWWRRRCPRSWIWMQSRLSVHPSLPCLWIWWTWRSGWMFYALMLMSSVRWTGSPWRRGQRAVDACCPGNAERSSVLDQTTSSSLPNSPLDRRHHVWLLKATFDMLSCSFPIVMTIVNPRMHLSVSAEGRVLVKVKLLHISSDGLV